MCEAHSNHVSAYCCINSSKSILVDDLSRSEAINPQSQVLVTVKKARDLLF